VAPAVEVEAGRVRPTDIERVVGDAARALRELAWAPAVPWAETLETVLSDWRGRVAARS
jgi:GDP-D-mannose dehydratase